MLVFPPQLNRFTEITVLAGSKDMVLYTLVIFYCVFILTYGISWFLCYLTFFSPSSAISGTCQTNWFICFWLLDYWHVNSLHGTFHTTLDRHLLVFSRKGTFSLTPPVYGTWPWCPVCISVFLHTDLQSWHWSTRNCAPNGYGFWENYICQNTSVIRIQERRWRVCYVCKPTASQSWPQMAVKILFSKHVWVELLVSSSL